VLKGEKMREDEIEVEKSGAIVTEHRDLVCHISGE